MTNVDINDTNRIKYFMLKTEIMTSLKISIGTMRSKEHNKYLFITTKGR